MSQIAPPVAPIAAAIMAAMSATGVPSPVRDDPLSGLDVA
jgi:hypothetical protein